MINSHLKIYLFTIKQITLSLTILMRWALQAEISGKFLAELMVQTTLSLYKYERRNGDEQC